MSKENIETLKAKNDFLKAENEASQKQVETLTAENVASQKQVEMLTAENDDLRTRVSLLQTDFEQATLQLNQTQGMLDKALAAPSLASATPVIPNGTFTVDGKSFRVILPKVMIPGIGERTADDILQDTAAQRALVEMHSGAIKHVLI